MRVFGVIGGSWGVLIRFRVLIRVLVWYLGIGFGLGGYIFIWRVLGKKNFIFVILVFYLEKVRVNGFF